MEYKSEKEIDRDVKKRLRREKKTIPYIQCAIQLKKKKKTNTQSMSSFYDVFALRIRNIEQYAIIVCYFFFQLYSLVTTRSLVAFFNSKLSNAFDAKIK